MWCLKNDKTPYDKGKTNLEKARKEKSRGNLQESQKLFNYAVKNFNKAHTNNLTAENIKTDLAQASLEYGDVLEDLGLINEARENYNRAKRLGHSQADGRLVSLVKPDKAPSSISTKVIFQDPSLPNYTLNVTIDTVSDTLHLAYCLQQVNPPNLQQLKNLASNGVVAFIRDELKEEFVMTEVVALGIVLDKEIFRRLLEEFLQAIDKKILLPDISLSKLSQLIRSVVGKNFLESDDLIKILEILYKRLNEVSVNSYLISLTQAVSHVLDAMSDNEVSGLSRENLHTPLYNRLKQLSENKDLELAHQATYACQALLSVPNDETTWQSIMRRGLKATKATLTLASVIKNCDPTKLVDVFENFGEAFEGIFDNISKAHEAISELVSTAKSFSKDVESFWQNKWYVALRLIDILLQNNELVKFEQAVYKMNCHRKPEFLLGLCQRLKELASNHPDIQTRRSALQFLEDLYQNDAYWEANLIVKKMVLTSLMQLAHHPETSVHQSAQDILRKLSKIGDSNQQKLYMEFVPTTFEPPKPKIIFSTKLLQDARSMMMMYKQLKDQQNVSLEKKSEPLAPIGDLKKKYLKTLEVEEVKDALALYVAPLGNTINNTTKKYDLEVDLDDEVDTFLASDKKVLLLIGEAGSGKSTFSQYFAKKLWNIYENNNNKPIPLYIWLTTIKDPNENLIQQYLLEQGKFSSTQIEDLKNMQSFVFILDGYDEIQERHLPFYECNKFDEWNAKVIISSRPEYLGTDYKSKFKPPQDSKLFQQLIIAPFSKDKIDIYIKKYVETTKNSKWNIRDYQKVLGLNSHNSNVKDLISNPFILKIAMGILPDLLDRQKIDEEVSNVTRLALYKQFVEEWFARSKNRLSHHHLKNKEKKTFQRLEQEDFIRHGIRFCEDLAIEMYKNRKIVVEYSAADNLSDWRAKYLGNEDVKMRLLRFSSPLSLNNNQYRFIHKSLFEHFVAQAIFEKYKVDQNEKVNVFLEQLTSNDNGIISFLEEHGKQDEKFNMIVQPYIKVFVDEASKVRRNIIYVDEEGNPLSLEEAEKIIQYVDEEDNPLSPEEVEKIRNDIQYVDEEGSSLSPEEVERIRNSVIYVDEKDNPLSPEETEKIIQ
ncbi:hypothetical protein C1645_802851 [Glomus cerebriforme]|uniref:Uncharacterized protein n=1 Tax=Glomus cerebriforme TaxID=658196 RepID=A0A397TL32_9GLOM|nr:hypothetical protein C1645_802851 [Glomus cerebriforme]